MCFIIVISIEIEGKAYDIETISPLFVYYIGINSQENIFHITLRILKKIVNPIDLNCLKHLS